MNKSLKWFFSGAALVVLLTGCFGGGDKLPKTLVVNVLDKEFYDDCHIPTSIQVPLMEFEEKAKNWPKDKTIVMYCSNYSCTASTSCTRKLKKWGFTDVRDYEAGMAGWYQAGYSYEGPGKESYLTARNEPIPGLQHADIQGISTEELKQLLDS